VRVGSNRQEVLSGVCQEVMLEGELLEFNAGKTTVSSNNKIVLQRWEEFNAVDSNVVTLLSGNHYANR